jgi:hypothetical protein
VKACLLILYFFVIPGVLLAQKPPVKFGDVSKEEMSMTTYDKDSTASAIVLADFGESAIRYRDHSDFSLDFERTTRIKILKKEGLKWADFSILLYKSGSTDEELVGLKAVTYNLEGGHIVGSKLKNDGIFKEEYDANHDIIKVTCPNVRVGSVIEINYTINSPFMFNFHDWEFQTTIPTVVSEYRAQIPEYFNYFKYMKGYVRLAVADQTETPNSIRSNSFSNGGLATTPGALDYMDVRHRWVASDVPAFKPEPYMTSMHDYISGINFELSYIKYPNARVQQIMGSWTDINKTFSESENLVGQIDGNGFLKKLVEELIAGKASVDEQIAAIVHYAKQNIAWNGGSGIYASLPLRKVLENKKGNSADINLLIASMLEKAGIAVKPVLLSTREHGLLRIETPIASQFNYVICLAEANGKSYLLDGTERFLPIGMLPERCLNGEGFAISKEGFKWIPLESKFKTRVVTSGDFSLTTEGALTGKLKLDCNGYVAMQNRKKYVLDGEREFLKDFIGSHAWTLQSTKIENAKEIQNNFTQEHEMVINENMVVAGDMIYLDPFIRQGQKENPFKSEVREYPVDFGSPLEQTFFLKLTVPEGYVVDELPQSKAINMPENGARYIYNIAHSGNQITITSMFHINKSLFSQLEYPYLREFYNQIVAKQAEQIVLKKQ